MTISISKNTTQADFPSFTDADSPVTLVGVPLPQETNATHGMVRWTLWGRYTDALGNITNLRQTFECWWDRQPSSAPTWEVAVEALPLPIYDDSPIGEQAYIFSQYTSSGWYLGGVNSDTLSVDLQAPPTAAHCDWLLSSYEEHQVVS